MRCYKCKNHELDIDTCRMYHLCVQENIFLYNKWSPKIQVGSKMLFDNDKRYWTVIARDNRFVICTRNWGKNCFYTILDLKEFIRGTDNFDGYYNYGKCSELQLQEALLRLNLEQDTPVSELEISDEWKQHILNYMASCGYITNPIMEKLEISYNNFVHLKIKEVKNESVAVV